VITIFSIPKALEGHVGTIQRNAFGSWARVIGAEILLIGDEPGVAEAAEEFGFRHEPGVERSELGTPLVSSAFRLASAGARGPFLAYLNADIVLLSDFAPAISRIRLRQFLLVGRRTNMDISRPIDFADPQWEEKMRETVSRTGELARPDWIDYFVLPSESPLTELPAFTVGRPGWDNWLIGRARAIRTPVIDGTNAITAVHQQHDYSHIPRGTGHGSVWAGPEESANRELQEGAPCGVWHATHVMTPRGPARARRMQYLRTRWGSRHEVDGGFERLCRLVEPMLVPTIRLGRRLGSAAKR
jgi:hypothetical protein